jgi:hypothetical protein
LRNRERRRVGQDEELPVADDLDERTAASIAASAWPSSVRRHSAFGGRSRVRADHRTPLVTPEASTTSTPPGAWMRARNFPFAERTSCAEAAAARRHRASVRFVARRGAQSFESERLCTRAI